MPGEMHIYIEGRSLFSYRAALSVKAVTKSASDFQDVGDALDDFPPRTRRQ